MTTVLGLPKDLAMDDDRLLPSILIAGMDEGFRLRAELQEAEADLRRLERERATAMARAELAKERYEANRGYVLDVWQTLKAGWRPKPPAEAETPA